ncbi:uncharacterized protein LOC118406704 [Branchiostoma floridae]|uniref:Uncharacterized protein LOC118406704 n=1 Tax=Branchiostoma floridae TaxID=7739 RepID=A0A9J7HQZ3_BRAFL|nr:uncharacterized protein LOC118406704 [Branchiostoma floridae]
MSSRKGPYKAFRGDPNGKISKRSARRFRTGIRRAKHRRLTQEVQDVSSSVRIEESGPHDSHGDAIREDLTGDQRAAQVESDTVGHASADPSNELMGDRDVASGAESNIDYSDVSDADESSSMSYEENACYHVDPEDSNGHADAINSGYMPFEDERELSEKSYEYSEDSEDDIVQTETSDQEDDQLNQVQAEAIDPQDDPLNQAQVGTIPGGDQTEEDLRSEMEFLTSQEQLYPGSRISAGMHRSLAMAYKIKHKLPQAAVEDFVKILELHCPSENNCVSSAYKLDNDFESKLYRDPPPTEYFCCSCCQRPLDSKDDKCVVAECIRVDAKVMTFYHMDVQAQLQRFYKDATFRRNLRTDLITDDDKISDIYDGLKYKSLTEEGGFLHNTGNLTFTFNTDGVKVFASSRTGQLWPAYLAINELPPSLRYSKKYLLLCGFWCNPGKPIMTTYLRPLVETLNKIYTDGVVVSDVDNNSEKTVRGLLLLCSVDLQAKALLANTKQYNGEFGCNNCEDKGKSVRGKGGHRIWPYEGPTTMRTHRTYKEYLAIVSASARGGNELVPHKGIKGASVFCLHRPFDLGQGFVVDWMHCAPMGVVKALINLWLGKPNSKKAFYIGDKIPELNKRLLGLKIPNNISHAPRSLNDRHHWKASQLRAWLLHFSLPVLRGVLNEEYYAHYALLVTALSTLVSDEITQDQLRNAETRLDVFCQTFEELYGEEAQTMNVHLLRHMAYHVKLYGPLFGYSCFGFEHMNGQIKRMVHGTRFVVDQITFTTAMAVNLQRLVRAMDPARDSSDAVKLAKKLVGVEKSMAYRKNVTKLAPGVYGVGIEKPFDLTTMDQNISSAIHRRTGTPATQEVPGFKRVCIDSLTEQIVYSRSYGREKARNNRTVEFWEQGRIQYGETILFCRGEGEHLAVLKLLQPAGGSVINVDNLTDARVIHAFGLQLQNFVIEVIETDNYCAVPITDLRRKCVFMDVQIGENSRKLYIGRFPNTSEHD